MSIGSKTHLPSPLRHSIGTAALQVIERTRVAFPLITFLAVATLLLSVTQTTLTTANSFPLPNGFVVTTDTASLEVAGKSTLAVLGYVDFGMAHLYVTAESLLLVIAGTMLVSRGRVGMLAGIILGGCAAGTLVLITGCPCGSGSASSIWVFVH